MRLIDKVALVTGAASGIGRATVKKFVAEGARVVAGDIDADRLADLANEFEGLKIVTGDVSQRSDAMNIVEKTRSHFEHLDILVNSAGITARNVDPQADFEERWDTVMRVNAKGTLLMCHAAAEVMRKKKSGAIVNLGSIMSQSSYPSWLPLSDGFNPYPVSKGAVAQMTRDMGIRLAKYGIRVNAVCPGFVYTALTATAVEDPATHQALKDLHPLGRLGEPEEVANVIAFLASDEASFVNGALWMVDGGYSAQ